jgi:large subunit ribosomal protein L15
MQTDSKSTETSSSIELHLLGPNAGAKKDKKRLGRGEASGKGKTSGKGGKGQTARTGGTIHRHFEGGQMPLYRRVPKVGFTSRKRVLGLNKFTIVSLGDLESIEGADEITPEVLIQVGLYRPSKNVIGVKLLGTGELKKKLKVQVHAASESARRKIEAAGGSIEIVE